MPEIGAIYRYQAEHPLGQLHRVEDPDIDQDAPNPEESQLGTAGYAPGARTHAGSPRMALDMPPDTQVVVAGVDEERGLVLVGWTDRFGTPRTTSVTPSTFDAMFAEV